MEKLLRLESKLHFCDRSSDKYYYIELMYGGEKDGGGSV